MAAKAIMANRVTHFANFLLKLSRLSRNTRIITSLKFSTDVSNEYSTESEEDEVELARNKSRLSVRQRAKLSEHARMFPPQSAWEVSLRKQRQMYAKFGEASGIDPGVMWPTREELQAVIEEEREWEPTLQERMAKARADRDEKLEAEKKRHDSVVKAMEKMPELIAQYEAKLRKKEEGVKKSEERKKRLLEEAKEFFGYDIDSRDPKFKQLQELKEAEAKKLAKQRKKEEKLRRMTASLTSDEPTSS